MYSISQLSCFQGLVGLRQVQNPSLEKYDADLIISESGISLDSVHPLLNEANIDAIVPYSGNYNYPAYNPANTYNQGDIVQSADVFYISLQDNNLNNPLTNTSFWQIKSFKSDYLRSRFKESDNILVNALINKKKLKGLTKSIFSDLKLFNSAASLAYTESKNNRTVGLEFTLRRSEGVKFTIDRIGLLLTESQSLTLRLFHTSQKTALKSFEISATENQFTWNEIEDTILSYEAPDAGGTYYLLYKESDLQGQAVRKDINTNNVCSCIPSDYQVFKKYSKHAIVNSVAFNEDTNELPDRTKKITHYNTTFGLNLSFQVGCDITALLCRNKEIMANAISYHRAKIIIEDMAYSTRDNNLADEVKSLATGALIGNDQMKGLAQRLEEEIEALDFDFSALNSECVPCKTNSRVRHKVG